MKLQGKCCKPANETEYELIKAVAIAAGYTVYRGHTGYDNQFEAYGIDVDCEFLSVTKEYQEQITLRDWVFKATHKDTGELVVPEWVDSILKDKYGHLFMSNGASAEPLSKDVICHVDYYPVQPDTIITRQPEQSWYERGGFPPAGEVCQGYHRESEKWCKVEILKSAKNRSGQELCACRVVDDVDDGVGLLVWLDKFRPLPEKKSPRDEWIKAVDKIADNQPCNHVALFGAIYDALVSGEIEPPTAHNVPE